MGGFTIKNRLPSGEMSNRNDANGALKDGAGSSRVEFGLPLDRDDHHFAATDVIEIASARPPPGRRHHPRLKPSSEHRPGKRLDVDVLVAGLARLIREKRPSGENVGYRRSKVPARKREGAPPE